MPTTTTTLKRLSTSVGLTLDWVDSLAPVARLTSVSRIDQHQRHTGTHTLVSQELAELVERPTVRASTFYLVSWLLIGAFPNACQVFDSNTEVARFGLPDKSATDGVVDVGLEASFSASQPLLKLSRPTTSTSCAFTSFVLKLRPLFGTLVSQLHQLLSTETLSIRCVCNICTAKVNTQTLINRVRRRRCGLDLNLDMVGAIFALRKRCRSWLLSLKQVSLVVANRKRNMFAAIQKRQANSPILFDQGKDPRIVINACGRETFNQSVFKFGSLAVSANPSNRSNRQVRRKSKQSPHGVVDKFLHCSRMGHPLWRFQICPSASVCKCFKRCINPLGLFSRGVEFARYSQDLDHRSIVPHPVLNCQSTTGAPIPPYCAALRVGHHGESGEILDRDLYKKGAQ